MIAKSTKKGASSPNDLRRIDQAVWTPTAKSKTILDRAWEYVNSVSYAVSLRWLFYRLLQDGIYHEKSDYKRLCVLLAKARKEFYGDWHPNTLTVDARTSIERGGGRDPNFSVEDEITGLAGVLDFEISHFHNQEYYVELWFEAKAMIGQFEHYTREITLRPFGGDPSVSYKWQIAKELEQASETYGKPIVILYFGDLDDKGQQIPKSAEADIRKWSSVEFNFIHCGLHVEQVERLYVPEDPERPGKYQWEALTDEQAREIISAAIGEWIDEDVIDEASALAEELEDKWYPRVREALEAVLE